MNFPAAATVLVFNVNGGESETSTAPPQAPITVPKPLQALPAPPTGSSLEADEASTKEQRIEKVLSEVDASAFETASSLPNSDVLLPDQPLPAGFKYPT